MNPSGATRKLDTLVKSSLGPLEQQVLDIVCHGENVTVRETVRQMGRDVAYTTIMTTLDRLYRKGILRRKKVKRAYIYSSALSLSDVQKQTAKDLLGALVACRLDSREELAGIILSTLAELDPALLDLLRSRLSGNSNDERPA